MFYCSILGNLWIDEFDFDDESIIINTTNGSGKCEVYYYNGKFSLSSSIIYILNLLKDRPPTFYLKLNIKTYFIVFYTTILCKHLD